MIDSIGPISKKNWIIKNLDFIGLGGLGFPRIAFAVPHLALNEED